MDYNKIPFYQKVGLTGWCIDFLNVKSDVKINGNCDSTDGFSLIRKIRPVFIIPPSSELETSRFVILFTFNDDRSLLYKFNIRTDIEFILHKEQYETKDGIIHYEDEQSCEKLRYDFDCPIQYPEIHKFEIISSYEYISKVIEIEKKELPSGEFLRPHAVVNFELFNAFAITFDCLFNLHYLPIDVATKRADYIVTKNFAYVYEAKQHHEESIPVKISDDDKEILYDSLYDMDSRDNLKAIYDVYVHGPNSIKVINLDDNDLIVINQDGTIDYEKSEIGAIIDNDELIDALETNNAVTIKRTLKKILPNEHIKKTLCAMNDTHRYFFTSDGFLIAKAII